MGTDIDTSHLRQYRDLARLLVRYGRKDLVTQSGLDAEIGDDLHDAADADPDVHERAVGFADELSAMGATYIKLGQLLSTRADLLPAPYLEALEHLQDQVDPLPYDVVREVIEDQLQVRLTKVFATFDEEPLASASLGQVHQATMRDGTPVAVKVLRPGVRDRIEEDLEVLLGLARLLDRTTEAGERYRFADLVEEFARSLAREVDYRREAQHLVTLGENLAAYEHIVVPQPVRALCTDQVITMELVAGRKVTNLSPLRHLDVDGEELADELFRAYLQQILTDGFVHADPHPGNVFLTDDGRIALLDLGMVVRVQPESQDQLLRLLLAVSEGDVQDAADAAIALGQRTQYFDEPAFRREVADLVTSYLDLPPEALRAGRIVMRLSRISGETGLRPAPELSLLGRTLLNLDAVGRALSPTFNPDEAIRRIAAEAATESVADSLKPTQLLNSVLDAKELAEAMPGRVNRIMRSLDEGTFKIQVDALDERELMRAIQKVANRVTVGLVLAALIVGAAMLMRVETEAQILGYPALAMIFFLMAALGGMGLVATILWSDRQGPRDR